MFHPRDLLAWLRSKVGQWWVRPPAVVSSALQAADMPGPVAVATEARGRTKKRGEEQEECGRFYFRRDILDQLDDYMRCLRKMRRADPDGYDLFSRIGMRLAPPATAILGDVFENPQWGRGYRPAFGSVTLVGTGLELKMPLCERDGMRYIGAKFIYFQKLKNSPPGCEASRVGESLYRIGMLYARTKPDSGEPGEMRTWWDKNGILITFVAAIDGAATSIRALKERRNEWQNYYGGRGEKRAARSRRIGGAWAYPSRLMKYAEDLSIAPDEAASRMLRFVANASDQFALSDVLIRAKRGAEGAAFGVCLDRLPYFFEDRDVSLEGKKKRIFHAVAAHERITADGKTQFVRHHFRGERRFEWNGYKIQITVPGLHHRDLAEADFGVEEFAEPQSDRDDLVPAKKLGQVLSRHLAQTQSTLSERRAA